MSSPSQRLSSMSPSSASSGDRNLVFVSYSHADSRWLDRLRVHLKPLERQGVIALWDDTRIKPGTPWREEIRSALADARVAVLLVSADFLASDFIGNNELPPLLHAAKEHGTLILPLIIKPSRFEQTKELACFQAVNPPSKPLSLLTPPRREEWFVRLSGMIEEALSVGGSSGRTPRRHQAKDKDSSFSPPEILQMVTGIGMLLPTEFERRRVELTTDAKLLLADVRAENAEGRLATTDLFRTIRCVLGFVMHLAWVFDESPPLVYCANVMRFRPVETILAEDEFPLQSRMEFIEPGTHYRTLRGVLDLDVQLSASMQAATLEPDPELRAFALPVPRVKNEWAQNQEQYFLPGAPALYVTRSRNSVDATEPLLYYCGDTFELSEYCARTCMFTQDVIYQLRNYFRVEKGHAIQSFVSVALRRGGEPTPLGVLNIHRNAPAVLSNAETSVQFFSRLSEITYVLMELVDLSDGSRSL